MAQIQTFGFITHVQQPYVLDTPQESSRHRKHARHTKGDKPAVCHSMSFPDLG